MLGAKPPAPELEPEVRLRAAMERAQEALELYRSGCHEGAHYAAGLAVECLLRAYYERTGHARASYYTGHSVRHLFALAEFVRYLPVGGGTADAIRVAVDAALSDVETRWRNKHKYWDRAKLMSLLGEAAGAEWGAKLSERPKRNSTTMVNAALEIVTVGRLAWGKQPL